MGCCSAVNCSNRSDRKGRFKLFRFPSDPVRRKRWILNCRRKNWTPGRGASLCEVHFDQNQFEWRRKDGQRKLKPNAIPTIFSMPEKSDSDESEPSKRNGSSKGKAPHVIYLCSNLLAKEEVPDSTSDSNSEDVPEEQYLIYTVSYEPES